ncbi:Diacylglycerol O-acyltransferase 1C [Fusarium oxysporum f. sp. albedinis]|nr:Diacylglycerol O-acyltransferase 1C [Fusarium oxysporum f. sp. albedinis]
MRTSCSLSLLQWLARTHARKPLNQRSSPPIPPELITSQKPVGKISVGDKLWGRDLDTVGHCHLTQQTSRADAAMHPFRNAAGSSYRTPRISPDPFRFLHSYYAIQSPCFEINVCQLSVSSLDKVFRSHDGRWPFNSMRGPQNLVQTPELPDVGKRQLPIIPKLNTEIKRSYKHSAGGVNS